MHLEKKCYRLPVTPGHASDFKDISASKLSEVRYCVPSTEIQCESDFILINEDFIVNYPCPVNKQLP